MAKRKKTTKAKTKTTKTKKTRTRKTKVDSTPTPREQLLRLLDKPKYTFNELCDHLELPPKKLNGLLLDLAKINVAVEQDKEKRYYVEVKDLGHPEDKEFEHKLKSGSVHRIALVSDTHLCSHNQQLTHLRDFYNVCADVGVKNIYHSGDMFAGDGKVYRGQEFEIFIAGFDSALQYGAEYYPKVPGITTHFITGNHDLSWYQRGGADIGHALEEERADMHYLGQCGAYIKLTEDVRLYLHHPAGGKSYALSYKVQKFVESLAPEQRPQILASGHLHSQMYMNYLGVKTFMVPCWESQNTFLKRLGLHPIVGGWILELEVEGSRIPRISMDDITYAEPIDKDWD
jgi:UDP-2,3-diacylglucosamine pyrophosphatase LpxH